MLGAALITGLGLGSMYALLALGFHVTFIVSRTVNFAQGSAMMVGAVLGYTFYRTLGWPLPLAVMLTLLLAAVYGLAIERFLVHPFARRGSEAWLMATVAGGLLVDNIVLFTFGKEPRQFPSLWAQQTVEIAGSGVFIQQLLVPLAGLFIAAGLILINRYTGLGRVLRATVQNAEAAALMGIRVQRVIAVAYAVSTVFAAIAGLLIAPLYSVSSEMGTLFGLKAFSVAILGGIGSAGGVIAAGLLFGVVEALTTVQFGSAFTQIVTFSLVIVALALRPAGLFGQRGIVKV